MLAGVLLQQTFNRPPLLANAAKPAATAALWLPLSLEPMAKQHAKSAPSLRCSWRPEAARSSYHPLESGLLLS